MIDPVVAQRAFLDALAIGESGGRYDILCGGGRFTDYSKFPQWEGFQGPDGISHAAGKYQFEPATWNEVATDLKLQDFSPKSQDAGAWSLANHVYQTKTGRDLLRDLTGNNTAFVVPALRSTWVSLGSSFDARFNREVIMLTGVTPPPAPSPTPAPPAPPAPSNEIPSTDSPQAITMVAAILRIILTILGSTGIVIGTTSDQQITAVASGLVVVAGFVWEIFEQVRQQSMRHSAAVMSARRGYPVQHIDYRTRQ